MFESKISEKKIHLYDKVYKSVCFYNVYITYVNIPSLEMRKVCFIIISNDNIKGRKTTEQSLFNLNLREEAI